MALFDANEWQMIREVLQLTPRQSQVLSLILAGKNDKEIATALRIGTATVRTHVSRLFERLDVTDRTQLVVSVFHVFRRDVEGSV